MMDSYNLGWKLSAVIKGVADRCILDTCKRNSRSCDSSYILYILQIGVKEWELRSSSSTLIASSVGSSAANQPLHSKSVSVSKSLGVYGSNLANGQAAQQYNMDRPYWWLGQRQRNNCLLRMS